MFGIKTEDRFSHIYVIGKTGTGKSTLLEGGTAEAKAKGNLGPSGVSANLEASAYIVTERIDQKFKVAGVTVDVHEQAGIGVEAKAAFGIAAKDANITTGIGPFELGVALSKN